MLLATSATVVGWTDLLGFCFYSFLIFSFLCRAPD